MIVVDVGGGACWCCCLFSLLLEVLFVFDAGVCVCC